MNLTSTILKFNPVTIVMLLFFIFPILKGFLMKYSSTDLKMDIEDTNKTIMFIVSLFLGVYFGKKIFIEHSSGIYAKIYQLIPKKILSYINKDIFIVYVVVVPILILILYKIITTLLRLVNSITIYPLLDGLERSLKNRSNGFKRILGALFNVPKSIAYVLIIAFVLNFVSIFTKNTNLNAYLNSSKPYKYVCEKAVIPITNSKIANRLPKIVNNSFRIVVKDQKNKDITIPLKDANSSNGRTIVYYNGVTLDEGVRSNNKINSFSRNLVRGESSVKERAKLIYNWIGTNIEYDHDKADRVLKDDFNVKSGAIPTFNTRTGICFDYAALYVAMSKANNMKVRLITGEGFNGVSWISHSWNQVYLPDENRWMNVDPTFYKGGDYFDSRRFKIDHRNAQIAGEW